MTQDRPPDRAVIEEWLFDDFCAGLTDSLSAMLAEPPVARWKRLEAGPGAAEFLWRQPLAPLTGELLLAGTQAGTGVIAQQVMSHLGVETASPEELAATAREAFAQAFGRVARSLASRLGLEVTPAPAGPSESNPPALPPEAAWAGTEITAGQAHVSFALGVTRQLGESILAVLSRQREIAAAPEAASAPLASLDPPARSPAALPEDPGPANLHRLLDVELPVKVSFGKSQIQLKDLLRLASGSIIELSRTVADPVDIIVNNVVIARGEVVVVEGNFGVRIQRILSRRERLEALP